MSLNKKIVGDFKAAAKDVRENAGANLKEAAKEVTQAAGEVEKSQLSYRHKCNFDVSRKGKLNKNQMQCARLIETVLVVFGILIEISLAWNNFANPKMTFGQKIWNCFCVYISYYSAWGAWLAFGAHIFSIIACNREGWFRTAYIANEISFAVNSVIMLLFWLILWPWMSEMGMLDTAFAAWYQGLLHLIPWVTTVAELAMTDIALEKTHWKIMALVMFPVYALANCFGSLVWNADKPGYGNIYGIERWNSHPHMAILLFIIGAFFQGGVFYCLCVIVEKFWPKRAEEEFKSLL